MSFSLALTDAVFNRLISRKCSSASYWLDKHPLVGRKSDKFPSRLSFALGSTTRLQLYEQHTKMQANHTASNPTSSGVWR
jgi:hypothetical protein